MAEYDIKVVRKTREALKVITVALEGHYDLKDADGIFRSETLIISLGENLPAAVRTKVEDALLDIAKFKGFVSGVT